MKAETQAKLDQLNAKQRLFCINYTNRSKETFGNQYKSFIAAGYNVDKAKESNKRRRASQVYANSKVKDAISALLAEKDALTEQDEGISLAMLDAELFAYLHQCKEEGDRTNTASALRLIGQRLSAYTDKQISAVIEPEPDIADLDALLEQAKEFKRLASIPAEYRQIESREVPECFTAASGLIQGNTELVEADRGDNESDVQGNADV